MAYQVVERCELNIGERVGNRYVVEKVLGEGSFGKVYRVKDTDGTIYALKLLHLWDVTPDIRQPLIERFEMEFETGQIDCEYLVQSVDYGKVGGNPYIVMEFCPGGDLTPFIGQNTHKTAEICQQILMGLRTLHLNGKVHRDLKPENVLFKANGVAALTDFGIAGDRNHRMTERNILGRPQQVFGTYAYMPPEQVNRQGGGVTVLPTTDIFSFGVMAFQLLTGKLPFGELTNHNELVNYQKRGKNGDWSRHLLNGIENSNQWMQLLEGCLQANLKKRIQSVDDILRLLPDVSHPSVFKPTPPVDTKNRNEAGTCLRVMQGEQYGTIYNLSDMLASGKRIITLGREVGNLIALKDDMSYYMSRYHCCIEAHSSSGWILRDGQWNVQKKQWMESSNGTYVNSKQVSQLGHILETGDIISIGDIKIRFEINYH
jgi:serine/threonine protein kinase